jgi:hypothetical protein
MKGGVVGPEMISIARQRHSKHVSVVKNNNSTTEKLLEAEFSMLFVSSLTMMLHKDYDRKGSLEEISGRKSQGASRQDELIGGKPPVVK